MSIPRRNRDPLFNCELNVDDYEKEDKLGEGGFGKVYKVRKKGVGEKGIYYALKEIDLTKLRGRPLYEAQLLEKLQHTNIVKYYGHKETASKMCILMEYCDGGNLDQYIKKRNPIELQTVIDIMYQLISALDYLHKNNVMHRDLTVGNILFKKKGATVIKLADFGLSRPATKADVLKTRAGTAPFMSPDLRNGEYHRTADYYALGATLYMMLVGKPPPEAHQIRFDKDGIIADGKILDDLYQSTLERPNGSQQIANAAKDLVRKLMSMDGSVFKHDFLEEVKQHDFLLSLERAQLDKKSSQLISSQGFNNSYRPDPVPRPARNRSRSNTRDSAYESVGHQSYPRTINTNGPGLSLPTHMQSRTPSVEAYQNRQVSNPNPRIVHSDNKKTRPDEKWPVKEMRHLAPFVYVPNRYGRFIYDKRERNGYEAGEITFEATDKHDRIFRIVKVENAGDARNQKVIFYEPEGNPKKPTDKDPPLAFGKKISTYYKFEDIPYEANSSGLYNLIYKSHEFVASRIPQYELRNPYGVRGVSAKLYYNGDCRGQYLKKNREDGRNGRWEIVHIPGESLGQLTKDDEEYFEDVYKDLVNYHNKRRRYCPEKMYEQANINQDWRPKN